MKGLLVVRNVQVVNVKGDSAVLARDGSIVPQRAEVLGMGWKMTVQNSKKVPDGEYASLSVETEITDEAKAWRARDGRSGALISQEVRFGDVIEVSPLKK